MQGDAYQLPISHNTESQSRNLLLRHFGFDVVVDSVCLRLCLGKPPQRVRRPPCSADSMLELLLAKPHIAQLRSVHSSYRYLPF